MKAYYVAGALYIAFVVLLVASLIWYPPPEFDDTEDRERSRGNEMQNVNRKVKYCMREVGPNARSKVYKKCLNSPIPR